MTGLAKLDEAMGAMLPGEMVVIAARPGQGKSALGVQIAMHAAERGRPGLIVSLEMRDTELVKRKLCEFAELDSRDVRSGRLSDEHRQQLHDAAQQLTDLPLRLWSPPSATLADIRAVARRAKAKGGLQLLVVDYLGLVRPGSEDRRLPRFEQVQNISAGLKSLSKELNLPVISLCQLNREADQSAPRLSHLRESGAIEQDADLVIFLHHPESPAHIAGEQPYAQTVNVIVAKHRHGQVGKVSLLWHPRETRFSSPDSF
jgi:replicative DNA helicase